MQDQQIKVNPFDDEVSVGNPVFVDERGIEYEVDRKTGAHRRLTPKKIDKRVRRKLRKNI